MKRIYYTLALPCCLLLACNEPKADIALSENFSAEVIKQRVNALDQLLTKEQVAKALNISVEKIESSFRESIHDDMVQSILYSWPTGKKISVGNAGDEIEEYHSVSIGHIKSMTADAFHNYYGTNAGIQQYIDAMPKQAHYNKELATVEAAHLQQYATKRSVEQLPSVGSGAYWETPNMHMHVLADDVAFTISVNVGDDAAAAKKHSLAILNVISNP